VNNKEAESLGLHLFEGLGTWQEVTNAVNPSIDLLFSMSLN